MVVFDNDDSLILELSQGNIDDEIIEMFDKPAGTSSASKVPSKNAKRRTTEQNAQHNALDTEEDVCTFFTIGHVHSNQYLYFQRSNNHLIIAMLIIRKPMQWNMMKIL